MGKPKKVEVDDDDAVFAQRALELKDEGARLLEKKQYKAAAGAYAQCLELSPPADVTLDAHLRRVECFAHLRQHADVVVEATRALKLDPSNASASLERAKAYAAVGQLKKAKADADALAKFAPDSAEAKAAKDAAEPAARAAAKGLGGLGLGGGLGEKGGKKPSKAEREKAAKEAAEEREKQRAAAVEKAREAQYARARAQQQAWGPPVTVKALRGEADLRAFIVPSMISHKDLMTCLKNKFPGESFVVSYADETGAKKPLNATSDVKAAMLAAMKTANDPANKDAPKGLHGLPSAKLYLEDEASAAEAAPAPAEGAAEGAAPPTQVVEIDEWILDFAALFREHLGVDAEAHLDLHAEGLEMCNNALKAEVSVADAETSLDDAAGKFQHAAALALYNWGNVHMCAARKAMDGGRDPPLEEGGPPGAAIATAKHFDQVVQRLDQAEAKFTDALEVKPDFWDAMIAMSQRKYERARLLSAAAGLSGDDAAGPAPGHDAAARGREAEAEFASAVADFGDLLAKLPEEPEKEKPAPEQKAEEKAAKEGGAEEEPAPEQPSAKAQVLVMWGNTLFEQSQMRAKTGEPWRPLLDQAVEKFKEAGCAQADIDQALKVHRGVRNEAK